MKVESVERADEFGPKTAAADSADDDGGADGAFEFIGAVSEKVASLSGSRPNIASCSRRRPVARKASSGAACAVRNRSPKIFATAAV